MSDTFVPDAPEGVPADGVSVDAVENNQTDQAANNADSATADDNADDAGADQPGHKPNGVQKRIGELTANWRQAERERDYWHQMATRGGQQPAQQPQAPQAPQQDPLEAMIAQRVGPAPRPGDFPAGEFDEGYREARERWVEQRAEVKGEIAAQRQLMAVQARAVEQQLHASLNQQLAEIEKADPEARAAVGDLGNRLGQRGMSQLANMIAELGGDVAYAIAKNPELEARILSARTPMAVAIELGEIRATVRAQRTRPAPQPTSAPPPPPRGVRGGGSGAPDPDKMTMAQYAATYGKDLSHRSI